MMARLLARNGSLWAPMRRALGRVGLGLTVSAGPALAQPAPLPPIPQHWMDYAQRVGNQFQDRLSDAGNGAVLRLHGALQTPAPPLVLRVWIAAAGAVERLEFESLGQARADADLRSLLMSGPWLEPPPGDMRQPLVLQLSWGVAAQD